MGIAAYFYLTYRPLIEATIEKTFKYKYQDSTKSNQYTKVPLTEKESLPSESSLRQLLPEEAKPYEQRIQQEVQKFKGVPLKGLLGMAQSKISQARSKLNEASAKLARANPQDPVKRGKVQKARQLVPKAHGLLNRADSILQSLNNMQESILDLFKKFKK